MRVGKERLTVTVDPHLVEAAQNAVAEGQIESLSAWVNLALTERAEKERRLRALGEAIAAYEGEFGTLTPEELAAQARADRAGARIVRGRGAPHPRPSSPRRRRRVR
jgi:Arc/MetJ-type ribon-helix-helix transcriptional regulator